MAMEGLLERPTLRRLPQVAIVPKSERFAIEVNHRVVLEVADELDAHHWAKHVTECVHSGITKPELIRGELPRLCETATRYNLHSGYPAAS